MLKHGCITLALAALLGGCASSQAPTDDWTRWVCDSQVEVLWRLADGQGVGRRMRADLLELADVVIHAVRRGHEGPDLADLLPPNVQ